MKNQTIGKECRYRFIMLIVIILALAGSSGLSVKVQAEKSIYYGDVNKNGEVDISDLASIKLVLSGEKEFSEDEMKRADVDADGSITEKDLELIKKYLIGSIQEFPAERLISELVITKEPQKVSYYVGENISLQGIEVTVFYGNGTSKKVSNYKIRGTTDKVGKQQIIISYTEEGITRKTIQEIEVIERHAHKYMESIIKEATCVEEGKITYTCSCGDKYTKTISKTSHSWDKGKVTKKPTKTKTGIKVYICQSCGTVSKEILPILGQNLDSGMMEEKPERKVQKIRASSYTKTYGSKPFYLNATTSGNGKLTYISNNSKVVSVSSKGKATIKNYGTVTVTVKASKTSSYEADTKKITIKVVPKQAVLDLVKSPEARKISIAWKKDKSVTGYEVNISRKSKFQSQTIMRNYKFFKTKVTVVGFPTGKTYYIRIRSYKKIGNSKYYSKWSKVKKVKVR